MRYYEDYHERVQSIRRWLAMRVILGFAILATMVFIVYTYYGVSYDGDKTWAPVAFALGVLALIMLVFDSRNLVREFKENKDFRERSKNYPRP